MIVLMTASQFITPASNHGKEPEPKCDEQPVCADSENHALRFSFGVRSFKLRFSAGRDVVLAGVETGKETMGQQFVRHSQHADFLGSEAHKAREARLAKKGKPLTESRNR
jgi:hypothetical protein